MKILHSNDHWQFILLPQLDKWPTALLALNSTCHAMRQQVARYVCERWPDRPRHRLLPAAHALQMGTYQGYWTNALIACGSASMLRWLPPCGSAAADAFFGVGLRDYLCLCRPSVEEAMSWFARFHYHLAAPAPWTHVSRLVELAILPSGDAGLELARHVMSFESMKPCWEMPELRGRMFNVALGSGSLAAITYILANDHLILAAFVRGPFLHEATWEFLASFLPNVSCVITAVNIPVTSARGFGQWLVQRFGHTAVEMALATEMMEPLEPYGTLRDIHPRYSHFYMLAHHCFPAVLERVLLSTVASGREREEIRRWCFYHHVPTNT